MKFVTELCDIIRSEKNNELESVLHKDPGAADLKTDQGVSLLSYAAYCRNTIAVQLIRKRRKNLNYFEAATTGDLAEVRTQLRQHPDLLNTYSSDGFTALGLSSFFGHEEIVRYLTENGADVNRPSNNSLQVTPLHASCASSSFAITEMLLTHGANPNVGQQEGFTPLHQAAQNGKEELVRLLVEHGADVRAKLGDGRTPLHLAEEKSFNAIAVFLRKHGAS